MSGTHNILVIGAGSIGERHLRCFQSTGRCQLALCETMPERREAIAEKYGVPSYASLNEALASGKHDAAVIAAPAPFHVSIARQLTGHGVHLLLEKPVSISMDGVEELADEVANAGTQVNVGYMMRGLPALSQMREAVRSGRFGQPVQLVVTAGQNFPFYRPAYREIYYADPAMGGGAIQDCITHHLNAAEWLVGPITRLVADSEHCVLEGVTVEDTVHVITRHKNVLGSFSVNQHQAPNEFFMTVLCERGAARFQMIGQRWYSAQQAGGEWQLEAEHPAERDDYYIMQANAFLDQIEGKRRPVCSLAAGIQTLKVNIAILESVMTRTWKDIA